MDSEAQRLRARALQFGLAATALVVVNVGLYSSSQLGPLLLGLGLQGVLGIVAAVYGVRYARFRTLPGVLFTLLFGLLGLGGPAAVALAFLVLMLGGAGWGRPLRLRGRILYPALRLGSDWASGERPQTDGLDAATRSALEALWLHDAQKEHASVPAFSRVSWVLAGLGAPPQLLADVHQAALEEIDHARRCFALAAGYGGRTHTAEPMPELLLGGLELRGEPFSAVAVESLRDGCLLEDYNADIARACADACEPGPTRRVLEQIAAEERSHAELSWRIVGFCLEQGGARVTGALEAAARRLEDVPRPTPVSEATRPLVEAADATVLPRHGRLPDAEWAPRWEARLLATRQRLAQLLRPAKPRAA